MRHAIPQFSKSRFWSDQEDFHEGGMRVVARCAYSLSLRTSCSGQNLYGKKRLVVRASHQDVRNTHGVRTCLSDPRRFNDASFGGSLSLDQINQLWATIRRCATPGGAIATGLPFQSS